MPSNTIPVKWLQDKNGNEFYPVTHKGAVRDDNGNPMVIPEVLDDLNDVVITPVIDNTQTYFENAVQDYDGNWYDAVIIGDQVWMAENLRTTHYADGTTIEEGEFGDDYYAYYYHANNDSQNDNTYGLLYNPPAVMNGASSSNTNPSGVQGIAPNGWHIPSQSEFEQLVSYLNTNHLYPKDLASTSGWTSSSVVNSPGYNQTLNNSTDFNAYPAGFVFNSFSNFGSSVSFQTCTEEYEQFIYYAISNQSGSIAYQYNASMGISVRCLYNGTVAQFRQEMAIKPGTDQILKYDGNHWVNTAIDHDFTFDAETVSTSSATVTFGASQRGTHFISAQNDLSITFSVNNESDNYLWVHNTGNSAIQIYIQDVTHNGSQVSNIYIPEDDIIIQPYYAGEIGIVCNSVGAFITMRCDLKYTYNGASV